VTSTLPPADWYPDPDGTGGLRYWDGNLWTWHRLVPQAPPPHPYGVWGVPPWKGASLGRPQFGPGALAEPARRLGARLLDILVLLPVFVVLVTVTLLIAAPHFGPMFPMNPQDPSTSGPFGGPTPGTTIPTPGFVWLYLVVFASALVMGLVMVVYETVLVARYGRTLGMRWLHIRPLRTAGLPLGWGRSFVRAVVYWAFSLLGWIGLLNVLWCLWDDQRQCLHDKAADSIVVNDPAPTVATGG
jgi:uncharacterized RDD family membrane protein YckC